MRAAFAVLANVESYNFVRRLAWNFHYQYRTGTIDARLPPHISLKQPFAISDLGALEAYMDELAQAIEPFEVELTKLELRSVPHDRHDGRPIQRCISSRVRPGCRQGSKPALYRHDASHVRV